MQQRVDALTVGLVRCTLARLHARQPAGRQVTAEEVAAGIAFLAQPGSGSSVGSYLTIDGGMATVRPRS